MSKITILRNQVEVSPIFLYSIMQNADYGRWSSDVVLLDNENQVSFTLDHGEKVTYKNITLVDVGKGCQKLLTETPQRLMLHKDDVKVIADYITSDTNITSPKISGYIMQIATIGAVFYQ